MGGLYDEVLKLIVSNTLQPVNAWEPIETVIGVSDEELKLIDFNALQSVNALVPIDVRFSKSKLVKPVQPSNEPSPIVVTPDVLGVEANEVQPLKLPLPIDVTFVKSNSSKAVQPRKAVSLIKNSVCGRDSVFRLVQPSKQE